MTYEEVLRQIGRILLEIYKKAEPRYRIVEDPDELGYWLEEVPDDDRLS